jgi:DNA-binding GntR family transcriptional regulator
LIEVKTITTCILEHLRGEIITFQLKGGERLNENQIASQLNVSRPPLREALQVLEQEDFIVSIPRKGRYVAEISEKNFENIHEARMMIECHTIDLLEAKNLRRLPNVDLALAEVLKKPIPTDDPYEKWYYIEAMDKFHVRLVESAGNELLNRFYGTIAFNISRYKYWLRVICSVDSLETDTARSITEEHCRIRDFIKRGEYDQARDCLKSHMEKTRELMKENFSKNEVPKSEALTHNKLEGSRTYLYK